MHVPPRKVYSKLYNAFLKDFGKEDILIWRPGFPWDFDNLNLTHSFYKFTLVH